MKRLNLYAQARAEEEKLRLQNHNLHQEINLLKVKLQEARRIIDKLPKTVDGVPIADGDVTYCNDRNPFPHQWKIRLKTGETFEDHCKRDNELHYSTHDLALADPIRQDLSNLIE